MSDVTPIIELKGLSKSYQEGGVQRSILDNVSLTFEQGAFVLLLGQSGSGKSTLLNLISGIDAPDQGDILIDGVMINRLKDHERTIYRRQNIGFIYQFFNLIPTLNVFENITLAAQLKGDLDKEKQIEVDELLARVGLEDRKNTFPDRLSGGEQQRVAILRALAHDPLVLLADEPTGNLDEKTGQTIMELLLELTRERGKTLFMATHDPGIMPLADKVYRVSYGDLVEETVT
ncbi:MAG: ABC transporter ATP-binding protein [Chloroflexota bacterium]